MKFSKHRRPRHVSTATPSPQVSEVAVAGDETPSLSTIVATAFTRLRLAHRVRVLRRLLMPVGPMALMVLGGGVFAKYAAQARWPRMSVSLDDAARVTSSQVFELVRYVEQSNPHVLQQIIVVLSRDATMMTALGASVAAIVMQRMRMAQGNAEAQGA